MRLPDTLWFPPGNCPNATHPFCQPRSGSGDGRKCSGPALGLMSVSRPHRRGPRRRSGVSAGWHEQLMNLKTAYFALRFCAREPAKPPAFARVTIRSGEKGRRAVPSGQAQPAKPSQKQGEGHGVLFHSEEMSQRRATPAVAETERYGGGFKRGAETPDPWGWTRGSYLSIPLPTPPHCEGRAAWPPCGHGCAAALGGGAAAKNQD